MKREAAAAALCALVLTAFFSFSIGVHWDAARWDTAARVAVERSETPAPALGEEPEPAAPETASPTETAAPETDVPAPETAAGTKQVNINTAGKEELMTLPGIGEGRAQAILDDREANGPFRHPEDITRVSGIGEGLLEGMLDQITTESEETQ